MTDLTPDHDGAGRRPRHTARGTTTDAHWWRTDDKPPRRRRAREAAKSDPAVDVRYPSTGSFRAVVSPWTISGQMLTPDWSAEQIDPTGRSALSESELAVLPTERIRVISDPRQVVRPGRHRMRVDDTAGVLGHDPLRGSGSVPMPGVAVIAPTREHSQVLAAPQRPISAATQFPEHIPTVEKGFRAYARQTAILTKRQLVVWTRDRGTLIQSLIFPALSMMMFYVVLGKAVSEFTGRNSAFGTVPLVVLVGAMFGSMAAGIRLQQERRTGLLTKFYVLPVHRAADLSARLIAELTRILLATAVLISVGFSIGWRFEQGFLPAVGIFGVALLYGAAFSTFVLTLALTSSNVPLVPVLSLLSSVLMFFNSGFAPIIAFPNWLQPIVRNQPMTCAIEVMRALAVGGPVAENLVKTLIWAVATLAVFSIPALRAYRRAASTPA